MRCTPLCEKPPWPGEPVIVAVPEGTARSHVMSPQLLPINARRFSTVISDVATTGNSGSGVFDAGNKCLLGIMSRKIFLRLNGVDGGSEQKDIAKYFVPASTIRHTWRRRKAGQGVSSVVDRDAADQHCVLSGPQGGPFSPSLIEYRVSASTGTVNYSIRTPSWLTASPTAGATDTSGVTIRLSVNSSASSLPPGAYGPGVAGRAAFLMEARRLSFFLAVCAGAPGFPPFPLMTSAGYSARHMDTVRLNYLAAKM
jgi:hypothetical protein